MFLHSNMTPFRNLMYPIVQDTTSNYHKDLLYTIPYSTAPKTNNKPIIIWECKLSIFPAFSWAFDVATVHDHTDVINKTQINNKKAYNHKFRLTWYRNSEPDGFCIPNSVQRQSYHVLTPEYVTCITCAGHRRYFTPGMENGIY